MKTGWGSWRLGEGGRHPRNLCRIFDYFTVPPHSLGGSSVGHLFGRAGSVGQCLHYIVLDCFAELVNSGSTLVRFSEIETKR